MESFVNYVVGLLDSRQYITLIIVLSIAGIVNVIVYLFLYRRIISSYIQMIRNLENKLVYRVEKVIEKQLDSESKDLLSGKANKELSQELLDKYKAEIKKKSKSELDIEHLILEAEKELKSKHLNLKKKIKPKRSERRTTSTEPSGEPRRDAPLDNEDTSREKKSNAAMDSTAEAVAGNSEKEPIQEEAPYEDNVWDRLNEIGELKEISSTSNSAPQNYDTSPDRVSFAALCSKKVSSGHDFILDVWAYLDHQYDQVMNILSNMDRNLELGLKRGVKVERGSRLIVSLIIPGLTIEESSESMVWEGEPVNTSFAIGVPSNTAGKTFTGKALIGYSGITIATVKFVLEIQDNFAPEFSEEPSVHYPKSAFASYASEDRKEVVKRMHGMKKIAPDLEIFLDVMSLRSGENWEEKLSINVLDKDIFYLFWSKNAAASKWVDWEWRLALNKKGIDYISPVPLESPDIAPPPSELASMHFNDPCLHFM